MGGLHEKGERDLLTHCVLAVSTTLPNNFTLSSSIFRMIDNISRPQVGGEIFSMKRSTLTGVFPDSYLANLFSGRWESSIERDGNGNYFLDFDPGSFGAILTYLRYGEL